MTIKLGADGAMLIGDVEARGYNGRGMDPYEVAELLTRKLVHVADTAPPDIREQAHEFRDRVKALCCYYVKQGIRSHNTTLWNLLVEAGHMEAAEIIIRHEV